MSCGRKSSTQVLREFLLAGMGYCLGNAPSKGVALLQIAALNAAAEPGHALLGTAVGESFGYDVYLGAFLNHVVADLRGGI